MRRVNSAVVAGLSGALVAAATLIQMFIDWKQSNAMGLENISLKLKLAVVAAAVLSLTALLLGLLPIMKGRKMW